MNKIICVDEKRKRAVLQSGVIISDFLKILEPKNFFYPPFPTERTAFIGGNVATNASGEYSFRFGCTRKYIRRIKVILSTGELIEIERGKYFASKDGYLRIAEKKINDYYKFKIKVNFFVIGLKEVEVEKAGVKVKMDTGDIEITIRSYIISDWEGRWENSPVLKFLKGVYDKYLMRSFYQELKVRIYEEAYKFENELKAFFNLSRFM